MICIIALVVFGFMAIFSAKYRPYAKEAFNCVFRRITLRKCDTAFDQKVKSKITGKLMNRSPKTARFVFRHFEAISWIFTIILIVSLAYSAYGLYNLGVHGTCDPEHPDECIFTPGEELPPECDQGSCVDAECNNTTMDLMGCEENCSCVGGVCGS